MGDDHKQIHPGSEGTVCREVALCNDPGGEPCAMVYLSATDLSELGASTADGSLQFAVADGQFRVK